MSDPERPGLHDPIQQVQSPAEARLRVAGSPLPAGEAGDVPLSPAQDDSRRFRPASPPPSGRALVKPAQPVSRGDQPSGLERAVGAMRMVLPLVQKVLPLLDGNIASAVSNILAPRPQAPPPPPVELAPVENALAKLRFEQHELRSQVVEQNSSLKRIADQLEMVKEATNRNTLEQQELLEDLGSIRKKARVFAWVVLGLLALSILVNAFLILRIQRVLP